MSFGLCSRACCGHVVEVDAVVVLPHAVADTTLKYLPEKLSCMPCVRWPPWARSMARIVSPGCSAARKTAMFACAPECGCTLACSAPKSCFTRSMASCLGDIDELAAAVVALAGVALGVLVRQARALRGHHRGAGVVLGGDHLQAELLPLALALNRGETSGSACCRMSIVVRLLAIYFLPISTSRRPAVYRRASRRRDRRSPSNRTASAVSTLAGRSSTNRHSSGSASAKLMSVREELSVRLARARVVRRDEVMEVVEHVGVVRGVAPEVRIDRVRREHDAVSRASVAG